MKGLAMLYDIKNQTFIDEDTPFYEKVTLFDEEGNQSEGENTYFLNACDNDTLKRLGFAKVVFLDAPPFDEDTQVLQTTGHYDEVSNTYSEGAIVKNKPLNELKELRIAELKELKEKKLNSIDYNAHTFQIDETGQSNIATKTNELLMLKLTNQPLPLVTWLDSQNELVDFEGEDFLSFAMSVSKHNQNITLVFNELRNEVLNATSLEEIKAVDWGVQ